MLPLRATWAVLTKLGRSTVKPPWGGTKGPCHLTDGGTGAGGLIPPSTPRATLDLPRGAEAR